MKSKLSLSCSLASLALICIFTSTVLPVYAASPAAPRWFEIEVIFFKQLGDKALLKEQFIDNELPKYSRSFDLLTPYLQPNITSLKQQLPYCNDQYTLAEKIINEQNIERSVELASFIESKTLVEIEQRYNTLDENLLVDNLKKFSTESNTAGIPAIDTNDIDTNDINVINNDQSSAIDEQIELTDRYLHFITLATDAELHFAEKKFKKYTQYPSFTNNAVCQIAQSYFSQILTTEKLANFNYNGFPVESVPRVVDGTHKSDTTEPYLISKDALRLGDITKRLRSSRNFKPLMHLGWRQIGVTRNKAIPMKIYAGENIAQKYQQALDKELYSAKLTALLNSQERIKNNANNDDDFNSEVVNIELSEKALLKQFQQEKNTQTFDDIFSQIHTVDDTTLAPLLTKLSDPSYDFTRDEQALKDEKMNIENSSNLIVPSQSWLLDGFLKVHLDQYLYVTADFNMMTKVTSELAIDKRVPEQEQSLTAPTTVEKVIHFNQDRRIITGEVHYFDHPYIGMVVQIRRFDPTKPEEEAISQVVR
jgi:hypothetical protein